MFKYPVKADDHPQINWTVAIFDVIIIDEISQVSEPIMKHIIHTINAVDGNLMLLCFGDKQQLPPIDKDKHGKVKEAKNVFSCQSLNSMFQKFNLTQAMRTKCDILKQFLAVSYITLLHN